MIEISKNIHAPNDVLVLSFAFSGSFKGLCARVGVLIRHHMNFLCHGLDISRLLFANAVLFPSRCRDAELVVPLGFSRPLADVWGHGVVEVNRTQRPHFADDKRAMQDLFGRPSDSYLLAPNTLLCFSGRTSPRGRERLMGVFRTSEAYSRPR